MQTVRVGIDVGIHDDLLAAFPPQATLVRIPSHPTEPTEVDLWIVPFFRKDAAEIFAKLRGVKVVQSLMAGVEAILQWLPKDVTLCDGRGIHDISTSEWVLAAILASLKHLPAHRDQQNRGVWHGWIPPQKPGAHYRILSDDLAGKAILIVGYGSIGSAIEARLTPFGVDILRIARTPRAEPLVHPVSELHALLPRADIIVLIVPATPQTRGMIGPAEIAAMRPGALLVNAARGSIVVTDALLAALQQGRVAAALDVTDPEPLPPEHPLWSAPNCLITPHIAGSTPHLIHRAIAFAARQVQRYIDGQPLENVVGEHGY